MTETKTKIYFDNAELERPCLASGTITENEDGITCSVTYSMNPTIAKDIGAELMIHEFNESAIYEVLKGFNHGERRFYGTKGYVYVSDLAHNLNTESHDGYIEKKNFLHGYVRADKIPKIDKAFTSEDLNNFRKKAYP